MFYTYMGPMSSCVFYTYAGLMFIIDAEPSSDKEATSDKVEWDSMVEESNKHG